MATTYTLISSVTVGSGGASTISFTSIPQTYTDLVLLVSGRNSSTIYGGFFIKLNGSSWLSDTSAKTLYGNGSSAASNTEQEIAWTLNNQTASTFGSAEIYFPNYTASNNKSASINSTQENNATTSKSSMVAWLWSQTAAITQIEIGNFDGGFSDKFVQHSTAYLYGISNA